MLLACRMALKCLQARARAVSRTPGERGSGGEGRGQARGTGEDGHGLARSQGRKGGARAPASRTRRASGRGSWRSQRRGNLTHSKAAASWQRQCGGGGSPGMHDVEAAVDVACAGGWLSRQSSTESFGWPTKVLRCQGRGANLRIGQGLHLFKYGAVVCPAVPCCHSHANSCPRRELEARFQRRLEMLLRMPT